MDAERLDGHKKILGIIYIVSAALTILAALLVNAVMKIIFGFAMDEVDADEQRALEMVTALTSVLPAILLIFSGIPTLIAGIGLLTKKSWGPLFGLIMGCLKLFWIPIGTAIGIYAIWIYSEDQRLKKASPTA